MARKTTARGAASHLIPGTGFCGNGEVIYWSLLWVVLKRFLILGTSIRKNDPDLDFQTLTLIAVVYHPPLTYCPLPIGARCRASQ